MLAPWIEHEITFNERSSGTPWEVAGAQGANDRGPKVLGTVTSPQAGLVVITLNSVGIQVVQDWIDNPSANYGIVFQNFEDASTDDLDFSSREASAPLTRPKLTLNYLPAAGSSVAWSSPSLSSLQNEKNPFDVNEDAHVSALDVLLVINSLNESAAGEAGVTSFPIFPDVSGDSIVSPLDALLVINYLARRIMVATEGEGGSLQSTIVAIEPRPVRPVFGTLDESIQRKSIQRKSTQSVDDTRVYPTETKADNVDFEPLLQRGVHGLLCSDLEEALQLIAEDLVKV
jgi:hypothetical protein